ncbi:MAG: hypothetical protein LBH48_03775, partial [Bifidobacteriaceae bacterium]|nr:hypothetical protein [Bifidobacteriaceae bacterium]
MLTSKLDPPSKPETTPKPDIAQRRTATGWGPLRAALKLLIRRPSLPLVHLGLLGFIGVMMMTQFGAAAAPGEIAAIKPEVAVVDHDDSQLSRALTAYLEDRGTPVEIGQTKRDLQDAAANSEAAYIAVIPAGYEAEFVAAARGDGIVQGTDEMPQLETVATLASAQSRYLDQLTTTYLHLVRAGLTAQPDADLAEVLDASAQLSDLSVGQSIVARPPTKADATRFSSYLGFAAYPLTAGVMILTGLIFHRFASGEVRRRNLAAPVPTARMTAQVGLAAGVVCVVGWVWVSLLGLFPTTGGVAFATESPGRFAHRLAAVLVLTVVPRSRGVIAAS